MLKLNYFYFIFNCSFQHSMSAAETGLFGWLEDREREFDRAYLELDNIVNELASLAGADVWESSPPSRRAAPSAPRPGADEPLEDYLTDSSEGELHLSQANAQASQPNSQSGAQPSQQSNAQPNFGRAHSVPAHEQSRVRTQSLSEHDENSLLLEARGRMGIVSAIFAQLAHRSLAVLQTNAKLEVIVL